MIEFIKRLFRRKPQYFVIVSSNATTTYAFKQIQGFTYTKENKKLEIVFTNSASMISGIDEEVFENVLSLYKQYLG